ncbi:MAG: hypothetical protein JWP65_242 [Ramlibacter sp.]|jgi:Zn-dependent protease with chaperone function|uniref:M48 family metalloprotease n=1 Tax=Ramlibacter sp. TaxID=1917967 RepID=UPI002610A073|nr:M48 family metalloprotease [Ramlibacter sp.]MDB5749821.1 hypothetical protein [Ramlibacter sp.]
MLRNAFLMGLTLCQMAVAMAWGRDSAHAAMHERCFSSSERSQELGLFDRLQADRARHAQPVPVPPRFHDALARLKKVARIPNGARVELVGTHSGSSASVLSSGVIFLSSRLWRDELSLDREEAAAVIAHELAHLELSHVKDRLCEAVAAAGNEQIPLAAATRAARQAVWSGDDQLAVRMMQANHLRELQADRRAAELLRLAGLPGEAVGRMLLKLARSDGGGYSGSHPALESRLENLGQAVSAR